MSFLVEQLGSALQAPGGFGAGDRFGNGVALSADGTVMVVGLYGTGYNAGQGGVLTYDLVNGAWVQRGSILLSPESNDYQLFGSAVALSDNGNVLAVGEKQRSIGAESARGGVFIYDRSGSTWVLRGSVILSPSPADFENFGDGVALGGSGTVLVVGASGYNAYRGAVYTFDWSGSVWNQRGSVLLAADADPSDKFGACVAITSNGNVLVVGAPQWDAPGGYDDIGGVYTYDRSGSAWVQRGSVLTSPTAALPDAWDYFGTSVAINADLLAVGAVIATPDSDDYGGVFFYSASGSSWVQEGSMLRPADVAIWDAFGHSASLSDNLSKFVSASIGHVNGNSQGKVYTFDVHHHKSADETLNAGDAVTLNYVIHQSDTLNLALQVTSPFTFYSQTSDTVRFAAAVNMAYWVQFGEMMSFNDIVSFVDGMSIFERVSFEANIQPALKMIASLQEGMSLADAVTNYLSADVSEGISFEDVVGMIYRVVSLIDETVGFSESATGIGVMRVETDEIFAAGEQVSMSAIYSAMVNEFVQLALVMPPAPNEHTAWAMNTKSGSVSEYTNFSFNSFAQRGNRYLAASDEGLFSLDGDNDDGEDIISLLKSGILQFNDTERATLDYAYVSMRGEGKLLLRISDEKGQQYTYVAKAKPFAPAKFKLGRGLKSRYLSFELESVGQDFDLESIEFLPIKLKRRV